jgi:DNA-binding NtrC family response regulator
MRAKPSSTAAEIPEHSAQTNTPSLMESHSCHPWFEGRRFRERLRTQRGMDTLIGLSPEMETIYSLISRVAFSSHAVLILGETGTGKELVARAIHANGPNGTKPFIPVDCGSLVPTLIEAELFGYVKGAFTGADRAKEGLMTAALGGTIFLDEIGELPLHLQAKLLRALQEREVRPVGATRAVPISARILAATNRDLTTMVAQGRFRADLYYRLNVVSLELPPLRERRQDIHDLVMHFMEIVEQGAQLCSFSADAMQLMEEYDWPGNVRELGHAIERAFALSSGPTLQVADLPRSLTDFLNDRHAEGSTTGGDSGHFDGAGAQLCGEVVSLADMEKQAILKTVLQLKGDKLLAAKLLGIGKTTLYRKLKKYDIPGGNGVIAGISSDIVPRCC